MTRSAKPMNEKTLTLIAERFRILADPVRLRLLHTLADGELPVTELVRVTGSAQASVSKHLQILLRAGLVTRRREGLHVHYAVADPSVFQICDVVCGSLTDHLRRELSILGPRRRR
jgi:DNA-binding transcriptional ArsR family regulator